MLSIMIRTLQLKKRSSYSTISNSSYRRENNITAATDDNGVDQAKDAGKNSIQSTQPATAVKLNAKMMLIKL